MLFEVDVDRAVIAEIITLFIFEPHPLAPLAHSELIMSNQLVKISISERYWLYNFASLHDTLVGVIDNITAT